MFGAANQWKRIIGICSVGYPNIFHMISRVRRPKTHRVMLITSWCFQTFSILLTGAYCITSYEAIVPMFYFFLQDLSLHPLTVRNNIL